MQVVPIKVPNALQRICREIDSRILKQEFSRILKQDLAIYVLPVGCLTLCMLGLHALSAYWNQ